MIHYEKDRTNLGDLRTSEVCFLSRPPSARRDPDNPAFSGIRATRLIQTSQF